MNEYPYPLNTKTGDVICQICGKSFKIISITHLKKIHNIEISTYKQRFPKAPIVSESTRARMKYSIKKSYEERSITKPKKESNLITDNIEDNSLVIQNYDIISDDTDSIVKNNNNLDLNFQNVNFPVKSNKSNNDKISLIKQKILDKLFYLFSNKVKENFIIRKKTPSGHLIYEYITDFADPLLKVIINFPDAFWHNEDIYTDSLKYFNLKSDGWKIIDIFKNENLKDKILISL